MEPQSNARALVAKGSSSYSESSSAQSDEIRYHHECAIRDFPCFPTYHSLLTRWCILRTLPSLLQTREMARRSGTVR